MAAGVGKTYRMLQEGRQAQNEGRDVAIGYLEPHDRPETSALAEGLEIVPRVAMPHAGLVLGEMDVDAVIRTLARARSRRRARPHECAGLAQREAVPGHRRDPRGGDRRHLDRQHPAPREPQRHDLRVDDDPGPRDLPRSRPRRSRRGRAGRPRARGPPTATRGRQGLPEGAGRGRPGQLLPPRQPELAARACSTRGRRGRRSPAPPHRARTAQPASRLRADPGPDRAAAEVTADPPPRLALRPTSRLRDRRGLGAAAGSAAVRRGSNAACRVA